MREAALGGAATIVSVAGGAGGVEAEYLDLRLLGEHLETLGRDLGKAAQDDSAIAFDADLAASAILSPGTAATAEHAILAATVGPGGLGPQAVALTVRALACRSVLSFYRGADAASAAAADAVGRGFGLSLTLTPGGLLALGGMAGLGLATGRWDPLGRVLPGVVDGARMNPATRRLLTVLAHTPEGTTVQGLASDLDDGLHGGRREGEAVAPRTAVEQSVPTSITDLTRGVERASGESGRFTVQELRSPEGNTRWIVHLPGTDDGDWESARDHTGNLQLLEGGRTAYGDAIQQGLSRAGARADDSVLLVGHSQGGMQAMALADDPDFGYDVRGVVTVGAPVAGVRLADDVPVLAIEHGADPVPQLDTGPNPKGPNQVNVTGDIDRGHGVANHSLRNSYGPLAQAVDNSSDPSIRQVVEQLHQRGFLAPDDAVESRTSTYVARVR